MNLEKNIVGRQITNKRRELFHVDIDRLHAAVCSRYRTEMIR